MTYPENHNGRMSNPSFMEREQKYKRKPDRIEKPRTERCDLVCKGRVEKWLDTRLCEKLLISLDRHEVDSYEIETKDLFGYTIEIKIYR